MASFTDAITQFNPYVSQLPVDAMVKVGMQKQAQYEEGVQKIQAQIDQVAGLDVLRDVDKNYLQSKLNELGNNLRTVAAGDFSNFQLVNSVSGMTKQIAKDKDIQTAVSSTAWARKQLAEMEAAKKAGKSAVQNQWDFNEKLSAYTSSTDLGRSFNDSYTPYIDVNKKWIETLKIIHPNLREQDIPYEVDPVTGKLNYGKIAAAMQRVTKEAVSADQIENAIRSNLSPEDLNQLAINGRYEFRGVGVPQLQEYAMKKYDANLKSVDDRIKTLEGYLNLTTSDPAEQDKTKKAIESLKASKTKLNESLKTELSFIGANPDEAKAELYKNGAVSEFANAFSWETNKTQLLTNPVLEAQHWEKTYALDVSKYNLSVRSQNWTEYKDRHAMDLATKEYQLKVEKQFTDLYGSTSGFHTYGGESTMIKDPATAMANDAQDKSKAANDGFNYLLKNMPVNGQPITAAMLEESLKAYANGDKSKIPVNFRQKADRILEDRNEALRINATIAKVEKEVLSDPTVAAAKKAFDAKVASLPTLTIGNVKFSQQDIMTFLAKEKAYTKRSGTITVRNEEGFYNSLSPNEKALYKGLKGASGDGAVAANTPLIVRILGGGKSAEQKAIGNVVSKYMNIDKEQQNYVATFERAKNKKLSEVSGKYIPVITNINVSNKEGAMSRDNWEGIAMSVLRRFETEGQTKGGAEGLNVSTAKGWLDAKDKDNIQYKKLVQGNKTYLVMMKGTDEAVIPLTDQEVDQLPKYKHEPSSFQQQVTAAQYMNNGNTGINNDPTKSIFQTNKFANVKNLSVTADLQWNDDNRSMNYINLNLRTPSGWKNLQLEVPVDADGAQEFVNKVTDKYIKNLYLSNPKVPSSWKDEIKNL